MKGDSDGHRDGPHLIEIALPVQEISAESMRGQEQRDYDHPLPA